jgi:hypothetical protein
MRDIMDNLDLKRAISPAAAGTDNTAIVSQIVDLQGYDGCMLAINLGVNTDTNATFALTMDESDASDLSGSNSVDAGDLNGTLALAGFTAAGDDNKLKKIGYVGRKRYVRATITPTGNDSGNIFVSAEWVLRPLRKPAANPPA